MRLPVPDGDLGLAAQDRCDQVADALLRVLVVPVGVDHDVGAELQRPLDAVVERPAEAAVAGVPDEVGDPVMLGDLDGAVGGAVVDDQHDDLVDARDLCGDAGEHQGEGLFLVEARDLNDQTHDVTSSSRCGRTGDGTGPQQHWTPYGGYRGRLTRWVHRIAPSEPSLLVGANNGRFRFVPAGWCGDRAVPLRVSRWWYRARRSNRPRPPPRCRCDDGRHASRCRPPAGRHARGPPGDPHRSRSPTAHVRRPRP